MGTKVVYNTEYGGFSISMAVANILNTEYGFNIQADEDFGASLWGTNIERHDRRLIDVIELVGLKAAGGKYAKLAIKEIEEDKYYIDDYDGLESVMVESNIEWVRV